MHEWTEQSHGWYFAHRQGELNLRILHMFEGTFLLDAARVLDEFPIPCLHSTVILKEYDQSDVAR